MSDGKKEKNTDYKFILLGDSAVGKTSFFKKLNTEIFSEKNISTIGIDKRTLYFKNIEIKINGNTQNVDFNVVLFDTAGQERYRAITKTFIQGSEGVIIMYDITCKKSFLGVEAWLDSITQTLSHWKTGRYVITLIGNKADLVENGEKEREVKEEEATKMCSDKEIYWAGECSVKDFSVQELNDILVTTWKNYVEKCGLKAEISTQNEMKGIKFVKKPKRRSFC